MWIPFAAQLKKIISFFESRQRSLGHYITIASKLGHYVEELRKTLNFRIRHLVTLRYYRKFF